ncbi:TPA: IS3 family transposase [Pseudomonas aeruginosa]
MPGAGYRGSAISVYASYQQAKTDLFDCIRFYNHRSRHSTLGYLSPTEFERRYASSRSTCPPAPG